MPSVSDLTIGAPIWRRYWVKVLVLLLIWTLFGLLFASQLYFAYSRRGWQLPWYKPVSLELTYALIWAALTPFIIWMAQRFRIERGRLRGSLTIHFLCGLFIGMATRILHDVMFYYLISDSNKPLNPLWLLQNAFLIFDYGAMCYWLILVIVYALESSQRSQQVEIRASRLQAQLAQSQLQALKMQLHPHFLFNTLNSISALLHKNLNAADTMIARLGDFLRLTLENSGKQEVSLHEELEFLKCYLEIERIRFQDRMSVQMDVEPETLEARLPNLILQPIVENAIWHGLQPQSIDGRIEIASKRLNGRLRVAITDNGPGLPAETGSESLAKRGVGLSNTEARLHQLYGDDYRFDLTNGAENGLTVTIEIPFKIE